MKRQRRIEITAFRRRTTIVLRDAPRAGGVDPDGRQAGQPPPGSPDADRPRK